MQTTTRTCMASRRATFVAGRSAVTQVPVLLRPCASARAASPHIYPGSTPSRCIRTTATNTPGGSVLDRPSTLPGFEKSTESSTKRPPSYKVMLHNDSYNRREYVVKVLLKVVKGLNVDDAQKTMQEAHEHGVAMVITCPQEDAERYCEGLRLNGLTSSIEPGR